MDFDIIIIMNIIDLYILVLNGSGKIVLLSLPRFCGMFVSSFMFERYQTYIKLLHAIYSAYKEKFNREKNNKMNLTAILHSVQLTSFA